MRYALFGCVLLALVIGCSSDNPTVTLTLNHVSLTLDMTQAPSGIVQVRAVLSREGFETRTINLEISENTASGVFENVAIGWWHLRVDALDAGEVVQFTGETDIEVQPAGVTKIYLVLNPANGSIEVNVRWASGLAGNALRLDGKNDYAVVLDSPSLQGITTALTMEAWVRPREQYYNTVVSLGFQAYVLEFAKGLRPGVLLRTVNIDYSGAESYWKRLLLFERLPESVWSHLAVTFQEGGSIKFYLNGELLHETTSTGRVDAQVDIDKGNGQFRIGARWWTIPMETVYYWGDLDEVRIWSVARTGDEIRSTFTAELTGEETGLVGYWNMNEGTGVTVIQDSSPNENHATLINGAQLVTSFAF